MIPIASLFSAAAPTTAGLKSFVTPYTGAGSDFTRGYAIQGVNSNEVTTTGNILAVSINDSAITRYDILNTGTAGAVRTAGIDVGAGYDQPLAARQPNAVPDTDVNLTDTILNNNRVVDAGDDRVGSSVYEVNGRIYSIHTITQTGGDYDTLRIDVIDSVTNAVLSETDIGDATHDYFQGSLAVNANGDVVVGYNRSGAGADGVIKVMARTFQTTASGGLVQVGSELLLRDSLVDDYHNGSLEGQVAVGRQRWGDYSAVSLDPTDSSKFWVIGEFARESNTPAGGHPGGTGGTRWSTWISEINFATQAAVPEPAMWAQMILGFALLGGLTRRARSTKVSFAA